MKPIQQKRIEPCLHTQSAHTEEKLLCGIGNKTTPLHHPNHILHSNMSNQTTAIYLEFSAALILIVVLALEKWYKKSPPHPEAGWGEDEDVWFLFRLVALAIWVASCAVLAF